MFKLNVNIVRNQLKYYHMKPEENVNEIDGLLQSELEQIEGGACQCDHGAGQVVIVRKDR